MNFSDEQLAEFLGRIDRDAFAAQVNTTFRVNDAQAELIEVSERRSSPHQESFSMEFRFPVDFPAEQGNYTFEHPVLGANEIFVVPVEQRPDGVIFQAIFNRLLPKNKD